MKKVMTIFGAILFASSILISSCSNENSSKTSELKDTSKEDSTSKVKVNEINTNEIPKNDSVVDKNTVKKTTTNEVKNEIMTLISGASQDCTAIIFKNSKGKEIRAGDIPDFIKWNENDEGSTEIDEKFCNKKYLITYTMKKYYCESGGDKNGSLEMNVSRMDIVK